MTESGPKGHVAHAELHPCVFEGARHYWGRHTGGGGDWHRVEAAALFTLAVLLRSHVLRVLFGWPLWDARQQDSREHNFEDVLLLDAFCKRLKYQAQVGSLATGLDTFTFLLIHYLGKRFLEVFILALIALLRDEIVYSGRTCI